MFGQSPPECEELDSQLGEYEPEEFEYSLILLEVV